MVEWIKKHIEGIGFVTIVGFIWIVASTTMDLKKNDDITQSDISEIKSKIEEIQEVLLIYGKDNDKLDKTVIEKIVKHPKAIEWKINDSNYKNENGKLVREDNSTPDKKVLILEDGMAGEAGNSINVNNSPTNDYIKQNSNLYNKLNYLKKQKKILEDSRLDIDVRLDILDSQINELENILSTNK
jgi:hypothetical protein